MNIYVTTTMGTGHNDDRTLRNAQIFDCILLGIKVFVSPAMLQAFIASLFLFNIYYRNFIRTRIRYVHPMM